MQEEPSDSLDPEMLGLFASIGIEKGKPFEPDARSGNGYRLLSATWAIV